MAKSVAIIGTRGYPSYYGGFETAVRKIAPYLADHHWNVTVYGRRGAMRTSDPEKDTRVRTVTTLGLEYKSLSTLSYGFTAVLHSLLKKPDVALVMNVANGFWLPLLRLRGIPSVVNVDGIEWERAKWNGLAKSVFRIGARLTARFGTILVADSKEIQRRWEREFNRECVFVPYGGDIPDPLEPLPGLARGSYVLLVARFVPENTVHEFFEAAERIARDYKVVLVGSSGYGDDADVEAKRLDREFGNVTWLGHVSDDLKLFALWQNCGIYFHGHSVGGTNPALVQAMACGAPTVARDTVYNKEVLGDAGLFCQPTAVDIERTIRMAMSDDALRDDLSSSARIRAGHIYTWTKVCGSYESTLQSAAGRPTSKSDRRLNI